MSATGKVALLDSGQVAPIRATKFQTRHGALRRRAIIVNHKPGKVSRRGQGIRCMQRNIEPRRINWFLIWDAGREVHLHGGFHHNLGSITRCGRRIRRLQWNSRPRRIQWLLFPGAGGRFRMHRSLGRCCFRMQRGLRRCGVHGIFMHVGQR